LRIEQRIERQRRYAGPAAAGRLTHHIGRSYADEAVAAPKMVFEKRDRMLSGQRREPQRELRELDGHRVGVDAEQAALRDEAPQVSAIGLCDLVFAERAVDDQRAFQRAGHEAAGRGQERTAPHRGVQHAQREDCRGVASLDERPERHTDQVVGQRERRVEASGRLARGRGAGVAFRPIVEQALVDRSELLDAEIRIGNPATAPRAGMKDERLEGRRHGAVVQREVIEQRRSRRREQAAVERRYAKVAGGASGVGQPRHRLEPRPRAPRIASAFKPRRERGDRVAVAVDRVPRRNQAARFGEQQEQDPVHRRQRIRPVRRSG
jgi:hypothetical protein